MISHLASSGFTCCVARCCRKKDFSKFCIWAVNCDLNALCLASSSSKELKANWDVRAGDVDRVDDVPCGEGGRSYASPTSIKLC